MTLIERLQRLEGFADQDLIGRDLRVIRLQLSRAEGKLSRGQGDTRREQRIIEQRVVRAEGRIDRIARRAA